MASMQYDVLASKPRTTDGQMKDQNDNDWLRCLQRWRFRRSYPDDHELARRCGFWHFLASDAG
jgi:hypothetical protein